MFNLTNINDNDLITRTTSISADQESLAIFALQMNNLNKSGFNTVAVYEQEIDTFQDSVIWDKLNDTTKFDKTRIDYLKSTPNLHEDPLEPFILENALTQKGIHATLRLINQTHETSKELVSAAFQAAEQLDDNPFPDLKKAFSRMRFHGLTSDLDNSADLNSQNYQTLLAQNNVLTILNFVTYSVPICVILSGVDVTGFQNIGLYLFEQSCSYNHYSTLSYYDKIQNMLTNTYSINQLYDQIFAVCNFELSTSSMYNLSKQYTWVFTKFLFRHDKFKLLQILGGCSHIFLGALLESNTDSSKMELAETPSAKKMVPFGVPFMRPR